MFEADAVSPCVGKVGGLNAGHYQDLAVTEPFRTVPIPSVKAVKTQSSERGLDYHTLRLSGVRIPVLLRRASRREKRFSRRNTF